MKHREIIILTANRDLPNKETFTIKRSYGHINNIIFARVRKVGTRRHLYLYGEIDREPWCYEDIKYLEPRRIKFGLKKV